MSTPPHLQVVPSQPEPSPQSSPSPNSCNDPQSATNDPPTKPAPDGLTEYGKFNVVIGVFGTRGTGKSTYALGRAADIGRRQPAIVLAHDPGMRLPEQFPNGQPSGIVRHANVEAALSRVASDPRGVHAIPSKDAIEVLNAGKRIAGASLKAHNGKRGVPVLVLIDEAVSAASTNPYRLGEELREFLALCRHMNVGVIYTCQSLRFLHASMVALASELVIFRLRAKHDLDLLEQADVDPDCLAQVPELPNYVSVVQKLG